MPYKIVQTHEKGKPVLTTVPSEWERDGTLFWPKNRAEKLLRLEFSHPEDNWIPIPCTIKRSNLKYQEAENELNLMQYRSDTEEEQQPRQPNEVHGCSLNELANNCFIVPAGADDLSTAANIVDENNLYILGEETFDQTAVLPSPSLESFTETLKTIKETQDKAPPDLILKKLQTIDEKQDKILFKLAEFSVQFQELVIKNKPVQQMQTVDNFSPIDSKQELESLENDLNDEEKKYQIYKKYSVVCKGKDKGLNCAYTLIDVLFTRKFLTKCSWAGGSRGDETKLAFKAYKNTISLFYSLIYDCDKSFSITESNTFLKNILRNSTKRNETKSMRTPACKTRLNKKSLTQKKKPENDSYKNEQDKVFQTENGYKQNGSNENELEIESKDEFSEEDIRNEKRFQTLSKKIHKHKKNKKILKNKVDLESEDLDSDEENVTKSSSSKLNSVKKVRVTDLKYKNKSNKELEEESNKTKMEAKLVRNKMNKREMLKTESKIQRGAMNPVYQKYDKRDTASATFIMNKRNTNTSDSESNKESEGEENIEVESEVEASVKTMQRKLKTELAPNKTQKKLNLKPMPNLQPSIKKIDHEKRDKNNENKATTEMEEEELINDTVYENEKEEESLDTTEENTPIKVSSNNKRKIETNSDIENQDDLNVENSCKPRPKKLKRGEIKEKSDEKSNKNKMKPELTMQKKESLKDKANYPQKTKKIDHEKKDKNNENKATTEMEEEEELINVTVYEKESENEKKEDNLDTSEENTPIKVSSNNDRKVETNSDIENQDDLNVENSCKPRPKKLKIGEIKEKSDEKSNKNKMKPELTPNRMQKKESLKDKFNYPQKTKKVDHEKKDKHNENKATTETEEEEELINITVYEKESENEKKEDNLDTSEENTF